jgi:phosphonopyruvate decarboxylase
MLNQETVFNELIKQGVTFFVGVPDSYLNSFCNYAQSHFPDRNIIAANEGNAIGIAAGHYFACKEIPLVYMQNSGLGNAVNPLVSMVDKRVYSVPMILLIGWRGQPGTVDWSQHELQGEITQGLLDMMQIPFNVLSDDQEIFNQTIFEAVNYCHSERQPYALIVPKGILTGEKTNIKDSLYPMSRAVAINTILDNMPSDTIYSATTGRTTRELFFLREERSEGKEQDYLNVGAMGHASSVALGIALEKPDRKVVVLDGDAAVIMHLGALTMVSKLDVPNYMHIVLNNGAHESVGGQPSAGHKVDFTSIAEASGYQTVGYPVSTIESLVHAIQTLKNCGKASFIDCRIHKGLTGKLPPLDFSHKEAIDAFSMNLCN